ncbi:RNA polymerase sigma factor [Roseimarinus sediminis]|uniref:RNA polymerase sigma factor n=1 Tax=Roseimarinus sediminis TaxID=1610899 RepID=UPI003D1B27FE
MELSDRIVWDKMREGDEAAFASIYQQYAKQLYLYGLKFTGNTALIEDCIQDLFISIFKNQRISSTDSIRFYLIRSFRNKLLRAMKREGLHHNENDYTNDFLVIYSIERTIVEKETSDEQQALLRKAVNELSARQKEAVYLRYTKGLTYEQVAEIMDMEIVSCRNLISKAIKKLREIVK